jgi:hypothetical protein
MRLPTDTTYEAWDALRRERFVVAEGMDNVKVEHLRYETAVFYGDDGNSSMAFWNVHTGCCYIKSKREAIFTILVGVRNYMMNALDAWEFCDGENVDSNLPWGTLFGEREPVSKAERWQRERDAREEALERQREEDKHLPF